MLANPRIDAESADNLVFCELDFDLSKVKSYYGRICKTKSELKLRAAAVSLIAISLIIHRESNP